MKQKRVISGAVAALVLAALLAGCGSTATGASSADSPPAATEAAGSEATAPTAEPQAEAALPDGVYTAEFETDSSMVHANEACDGKGTLTVADGKMTFHVSLASKKIVNLYLGTAEDAPSHESDWLQPTTDTVTYSDGTSDEVYGYDIPLDAVDTDFQLAILGTKGTWYDHTVSVRNAEPKTEDAAAETAAVPADGSYTCAVTLEGGSGQVLAGPDIVSRGFVYVRGAEGLMDDAKHLLDDTMQHCMDKGITDWGKIKTVIKDALSEFLWKRTKRSPMILPIIMEA